MAMVIACSVLSSLAGVYPYIKTGASFELVVFNSLGASCPKTISVSLRLHFTCILIRIVVPKIMVLRSCMLTIDSVVSLRECDLR